MVMGDDSCLRGRGIESLRHMLDGHDMIWCKNIVCLKRPKINKKESGPFCLVISMLAFDFGNPGSIFLQFLFSDKSVLFESKYKNA